MGMFDTLSGMAGSPDLAALADNPKVAELAAEVGIGREQVAQVLAVLTQAAAQPGDTAENAANASGVPLDAVRAIVGHMASADALGGLGGMLGGFLKS